VQALAGSLLNIKPIIHVDRTDGKYSTVGKARTIGRALDEIASHLSSLYNHETPVWVSIMHGKFEEQAQALASLLKERLNVTHIEVLRISPVLVCTPAQGGWAVLSQPPAGRILAKGIF